MPNAESTVDSERAQRDFEVLADTLPDIVIRYDAALRYHFVNRAAEAMIGRPREELVGRSLGEFGLPAPLAALYREHVARVMASDAPSSFEYEQPLDGQVRAFEIRVVPEAPTGGRPPTVLAIGRDITERRVSDALLRESEARWRRIANDTPSAIWKSDAAGPNTFINRTLAEFLGVDATALGPSWADYIHPDDRAEAEQTVATARRDRRPFAAEFRMRRADGAWRWVVDRGRPRLGPSGECLGFSGAITDITERREAEEQLRFAADASRLLGTSLELDELLDAVTRIGMPTLGDACLIDLIGDGRHTRRLGAIDVTPELRALADDFVRVSRPLADGALLRRVIDSRAPVLIGELTDGLRREFIERNPEIAPLVERVRSALVVPLIARGDVLGALTFAVLGSDRRLGEREVALATVLAERAAVAIQNARLYAESRDAAAQMRAFFDVKGVFFCVFEIDDERDDFIFAQPNEAIAAIYGYTAATLTGRRGGEIGITPERVAEYTALLRRCRESAGPVVVEFNPCTPTRSIWVLASLNRIERPNGAPAIAYVATDITERKQFEAQFLQAQKMEAVGRLAGGVAHDFNNLLTVIGGCADFLLDVIPEGRPGHDDALEVKRTSERAATLTRQLLTFSSRQVVRPRDVDVNVLARDAERLLRRVIGEDVDLQLALAPDVGVVHLDPGQFEQALVNLAVNARDAMPDGGRLRVSTARVTKPAGTFVAVSVTDTGTGMDEATRSRIFEPFFTTKPPGKGTGLGLAMVFGIVKQAGGTVVVESAPGAGSTFTLLIPAAAGDARPDAARAGHPPTPHGHERILLVEDDPRVRHLAQRVLELHGYEVVDAAGGAEALALPSPAPFDLLLTDVVLPGMNGRELFEALSVRHPGLRVLFMSGYTSDALAHRRVSELGAPFLEKPFAVTALVQAVRDALDA